MHPKNSILHLPKLKSDHRPILVRFNNGVRRVGGGKLFKFLTSWLPVLNFEKVVRNRWEVNENYLQAAESFIDKIKIWNWDDFGNISHKKKCILVWL